MIASGPMLGHMHIQLVELGQLLAPVSLPMS